MKPIVIDLFCGLGGWSKGFIAEGYHAIGFDLERHDYGTGGYPGELVLQDVTTLHGRQFKDAACIVASPPCQRYSYMAMPWKRAKALGDYYRQSPERITELNLLFSACFRLQREASEAAGRHIPMVVENVKGAQPWVGRANANYGSFYLWGDVRSIGGRIVSAHQVAFGAIGVKAFRKCKPDDLPPLNGHDDPRRGRVTKNGSWFAIGANGKSNLVEDGHKNSGGSWFNIGSPGQKETARNPVHSLTALHAGPAHIGRDDGVKQGGEWWHDTNSITRRTSSRSAARKAASAMIAEIPFELSRWVARTYYPRNKAVA